MKKDAMIKDGGSMMGLDYHCLPSSSADVSESVG